MLGFMGDKIATIFAEQLLKSAVRAATTSLSTPACPSLSCPAVPECTNNCSCARYSHWAVAAFGFALGCAGLFAGVIVFLLSSAFG